MRVRDIRAAARARADRLPLPARNSPSRCWTFPRFIEAATCRGWIARAARSKDAAASAPSAAPVEAHRSPRPRWMAGPCRGRTVRACSKASAASTRSGSRPQQAMAQIVPGFDKIAVQRQRAPIGFGGNLQTARPMGLGRFSEDLRGVVAIRPGALARGAHDVPGPPGSSSRSAGRPVGRRRIGSAGFLAEAVGAVLDSPQGVLDFRNQLPLAIASAYFQSTGQSRRTHDRLYPGDFRSRSEGEIRSPEIPSEYHLSNRATSFENTRAGAHS